MGFTEENIRQLRQLCGVVLPAWQSMPAADSLDLDQKLIPRVLKTRPELESDLHFILDSLNDPVNAEAVGELEQNNPIEFRSTMILLCSAYYLHPVVKKGLGYEGQQALTLSKGGFGAEDLVIKMMQKPKRYRDVNG